MSASDFRSLHHELLNHIAVVSTNAYLLQDSPLDPDQGEIVADIVGCMEKAQALAVELGNALELHSVPPEVPRDREEAL